jgi:hypothetical protein
MNAKQMKDQIHKTADEIENGVAAAATRLGNGAEALDNRREQLQDTLHDFGRRLLDNSKELGGEIAKQARLRPLAVFGVAFVAGIFVARVLRR